MKDYINAIERQRLSLNELYVKGGDEIVVGKKFLNIVSGEYTHYTLFELQCHGFKDVYYYHKESIKRTKQLMLILNKHLIGVKKLSFKGDYETPLIEIFFDEKNCLETGLEGDLGRALIELKPEKTIMIKEPHYLY